MEVITEHGVTEDRYDSAEIAATSPDEEYAASRPCAICSAPSNGYHFNAPSCSACAAFFRRTVTLDRDYKCTSEGNCRVYYAMRVICRSCRYRKCIDNGMDRKAVQPRRDSNCGRRKISVEKREPDMLNSETPIVIQNLSKQEEFECPLTPHMQFMPFVAESPTIYTNSFTEDQAMNSVPYGKSPVKSPTINHCLQRLLQEERIENERRRILYCEQSMSSILRMEQKDDIPFTSNDIRKLVFSETRRNVRAMIMLVYDWLRAWPYYSELNMEDRLSLLRRCVLYHSLVQASYLTARLGYPDRYIMTNGKYVGLSADSVEGWEDETEISGTMKRMLYENLMRRTTMEVVLPMLANEMSYIEYVFFKALAAFNSSARCTTALKAQVEEILVSLNQHYDSLGYDQETMAQRAGNLVLLLSSVYAIGMECLENHQKILFFDLWELDSLLLNLLHQNSDAL